MSSAKTSWCQSLDPKGLDIYSVGTLVLQCLGVELPWVRSVCKQLTQLTGSATTDVHVSQSQPIIKYNEHKVVDLILYH